MHLLWKILSRCFFYTEYLILTKYASHAMLFLETQLLVV